MKLASGFDRTRSTGVRTGRFLATHFEDDLAAGMSLAVELQRLRRLGKGKLAVDVDVQLPLVGQLAQQGEYFARRVRGDGAVNPRRLAVASRRRSGHGNQDAAGPQGCDRAGASVGIDGV